MAHTHDVVDSDARFSIDPITRAIKKEESAKVSLIVGDHNSERFSFELPRYIEGHDMSLCNVVRVHYMNTDSSRPERQSVGVYEVDDFGILSTDDSKMGLSWLLSNKVTTYVGKLAFTVQFACMTGFKVEYSWQSGIYSAMTVSDGINGSEIVFDEYADILQQWWERLYASSELPIEIMPYEDFEALGGDTKHGMLYMLLDDPSVEDLEKIPVIEQNITTLNTDLDNLEKKVETNKENITTLNTDVDTLEKEVETNKGNITGLSSAVQTDKQNIINLDARVDNLEDITSANEESITTLNDNVDAFKGSIQALNGELASMREAIETVDSKWSNSGYTKLYEYDVETGNGRVTEVVTGLYIIRAEYKIYNDDGTSYTTSTTVLLDTLDKESASTSISFMLKSGKIVQYRIGCKVINVSGTVGIVPYYVNDKVLIIGDGADGQCSWEADFEDDETRDITLYGRCIYKNIVG